MPRYETKRAILEEIGKKAQALASAYLTWPPDYDQKDLDELWQLIRRDQVIRGNDRADMQSSTRKPPNTRVTLSDKNIERLRAFAIVTKAALGLEAPISLSELGEELIKIKKEQLTTSGTVINPVTLQYPLNYIQVYEGLYIWIVNAVNFRNIDTESKALTKVQVLQLAVSGVSLLTNSHPALCLAFLLSDTPIYQHTVDLVMDPFNHMNIYIREPAVPMWLVGDMYQMAREVLLSTKRKSTVFHPRPRVMSERVSALLAFVANNKNLSWKQRWDKWNKEYIHWRYDSEISMRVVYYRVKPKPRKPKRR